MPGGENKSEDATGIRSKLWAQLEMICPSGITTPRLFKGRLLMCRGGYMPLWWTDERTHAHTHAAENGANKTTGGRFLFCTLGTLCVCWSHATISWRPKLILRELNFNYMQTRPDAGRCHFSGLGWENGPAANTTMWQLSNDVQIMYFRPALSRHWFVTAFMENWLERFITGLLYIWD